MRIGIFGNTNNVPYTLALGLRSIGVEVALAVNSGERLHRPESKHRSLKRYPPWILDCSDIEEDAFVTEGSRIADALNFLSRQSTAVLLNHLGPSLLGSIGLPAISLLTGSDLTYYANFDTIETRSAVWDPTFTPSPGGQLIRRKWREFIGRQREGIASSRAVSFPTGLIHEADALLSEIGVRDERRFFIYMADTVDLPANDPPLRKRLRILNGARLNWKEPFPRGFTAQDNKRTDILLAGFAEFLRDGGRGTLVLVEKGLHVADTRELAKALGIIRDIEWRREMSLAAFHDQLRDADVVCDQMGPSFPGMAGLDAMAIGRPVIANFRPDVLGRHFSTPWPVCQADSADSVRDALLRLYRSPHEREGLGREARAFAERHLSPEANAIKCLERLGLERPA